MESSLITALSTPEGRGGIAIIRLSGDGAWNTVKKIFRPKQAFSWDKTPGYTLRYGHIVYDNKTYDEVLLALMKKNASYTMEEMAEIQCHGGSLTARGIIDLLLSLGVSLAEPGEFTKRAFFSGRIDLSQAEAVIETIEAMGEKDLEFSLRRLEGQRGRSYLSLRDDLLALVAQVDAVIDFPEDEVDDVTGKLITERVRKILVAVNREIQKADEGRIYKEGLRTVILGRTNVGKSSLLNALLAEDRAIVTEIPGTTRDTIEETLVFQGVPIKIMDTAGIRDTQDPVEKIGVDRSRQAIGKADLILFVVDGARGYLPADEEVFEEIKDKKAIVLVNKSDLDIGDLDQWQKAVSPLPCLAVSAQRGDHLDDIGTMIRRLFLSGEIAAKSDEWVGNLRHKESFLKAKGHLEDVLAGQKKGLPLDFQAIDLRGALEALGEISGETISGEIIDRIFQDYCIGK